MLVVVVVLADEPGPDPRTFVIAPVFVVVGPPGDAVVVVLISCERCAADVDTRLEIYVIEWIRTRNMYI